MMLIFEWRFGRLEYTSRSDMAEEPEQPTITASSGGQFERAVEFGFSYGEEE